MKKHLSTQSSNITKAVQQVVAHRMDLMLSAGPQSSPKDVLELNRMWGEKALAATESWNGILQETMRYQTKIFLSAAPYLQSPWLLPTKVMQASIEHAPEASKRIISKSQEPIHNAVLANVERIDKEQ
jgi:hypothetical protein